MLTHYLHTQIHLNHQPKTLNARPVMTWLGRVQSHLRSLIISSGKNDRRATAGNAAVEFALASTVIMALLTPVIDLGMAFYQQMQVEAAAQAGAQYGAAKGWDSAAIQNAITTATALPVSASPAPTTTCGCASGTTITPASCSSYCPNGQLAGTYITANAQSTYTPIVPYSLLGNSVTLQVAATVRVQ